MEFAFRYEECKWLCFVNSDDGVIQLDDNLVDRISSSPNSVDCQLANWEDRVHVLSDTRAPSGAVLRAHRMGEVLNRIGPEPHPTPGPQSFHTRPIFSLVKVTSVSLGFYLKYAMKIFVALPWILAFR